tara:strand:+ start:591 stop:3779 length:3189 start_codon:yes stop_codon:yes gene_type:complete
MSGWYADLVYNEFGSSGLPSPDATTRDPELRKLISELEKIQGRYLQAENKLAVKAEIEVLKAQERFTGNLLKHEQSLADLDQKSADSQRDALVTLRKSLIDARKSLSKERSQWNSRAFDVARREASAATMAGGYPEAAAWHSLSDGLVADASSTVLDPQLPATLEQMALEWPAGITFHDDMRIKDWGVVGDTATRKFVQGLSDRARRIRSGHDGAEKEYNDAERSLQSLIAVAEGNTWSGMSQVARDEHVAKIRKQYATTSSSLSRAEKTSPYDRARTKRMGAEEEHHRFEERAVRLDWAWKEYMGEEGKASEAEQLKFGQAIYELQQSGWAAENGFDNLGVVFDDDGDGRVDRYFPKPKDGRALVTWKNQYNKGGGKYGLEGGATGELVRFEVRATPEQLSYLRDADGRYAYVIGDNGERVYLQPGQAEDIQAAPAQAEIVNAVVEGTKEETGLFRMPDGSYWDYDEETGVAFQVNIVGEATPTGNWISSEQTTSLRQGKAVQPADLSVGEKASSKTIVQYTKELPEQSFLREGEKMKIHAEDMMRYPDGSIRLRGGEVISADQLAGPVQVFASLTDEYGLVGPEGSWAKWKGLQAMGKVKEIVTGGALEKGPVASRTVGNIQYDTYGVDGEKRFTELFGRTPEQVELEEGAAEAESLGLDEGARRMPSDRQQKRERLREARQEWREEGSDPEKKPSREFTRDELLRGAVRGEMPGEEFEEDETLTAWQEYGDEDLRRALEEESGVIGGRSIGDTSQLAPTDAAVTEAEAIKKQRVPERTMASLAQEQRDWKAYQKSQIEKPPGVMGVGEEAIAPGIKKGRGTEDPKDFTRDVEKGLSEDAAYYAALEDWKDAGSDPKTEPKRPISLRKGETSTALPEEPALEMSDEDVAEILAIKDPPEPWDTRPEESPSPPSRSARKPSEKGKGRSARGVKKADFAALQAEQDVLIDSIKDVPEPWDRPVPDTAEDVLDEDDEGTFSGMPKSAKRGESAAARVAISPRIQALQDFKEKLQAGAAENKAARLKKKKDPTRPTDAVVAGDESVPGGSGVDKGTPISKEEEE